MIAITGGYGFLGWHTACRLRAQCEDRVIRLGRADLDDPGKLEQVLTNVDRVIHIAGVNRAESDGQVEQGNIDLAQSLARALKTAERPIDVVYANSIQAKSNNPYGRGKAAAAEILSSAVRSSGGLYADLMLPNLFGEHGRPFYNSFVATFAHQVASGRTPTVTDDRPIPLLHAQDAASALIDALGSDRSETVAGEERGISEVLELLQITHELYSERGEIPPLPGSFELNLFNTYRAAAFPRMWPIYPRVHSDERGHLFESYRMHGGKGQAYVSTTSVGKTRGEHYHLRKIERFLVARGEAEIKLRRLLHDEVITFRVSGDRPCFVDMPTMWVHNIRNVGQRELLTLFWSDQLLDPASPDQYAEKVAVP